MPGAPGAEPGSPATPCAEASGGSDSGTPAVRVTSDPAPGILGAAQPSRDTPGSRRCECAGTTDSEENTMAETWSGEFYCVKCKEKREASGEVRVNDKGTRMAKAQCPVCSTNLNRILGKA